MLDFQKDEKELVVMGLSSSPLPRRLAVFGIIILPIIIAVGTLLVGIFLVIIDLKFKY